MEYETVLYRIEDRVATLTLNRPGSLNALSAQLSNELGRALRSAAGDPSVGVLILTGAGKGFCAGGDLKAMARDLSHPGQSPEELSAILSRFHDVVRYLHDFEKPVIAALHGPAVGAGMSIALACDIRIAAEDTTLSQAFIRVGLSPDGGSTWLLPRAVGMARSAQLMMTGETVDAARALEWGILNEVVPAGAHLARAQEIARHLAERSPHALLSIKRLLRASEKNSFQHQLEAEGVEQMNNATTVEFRAALAAFLNRHPER